MNDVGRGAFSTFALSIVAPVVVVTPNGFEHIGTAFCVSHAGIWITARHILEGRNGYEDYQQQYPSSRLAIMWAGPDDEHRTPILVSSFTRHPRSGSDLALLWVDRPDISFPATRLNAFVPDEGTPICGLGYPLFENGTPMLKVAPGIISTCYPEGRESFRDLDGNFTGKLPTASYETNAAFDSLMSGGPVFQPDGSVCGVVATGMDEGVGDVPAVSFASATPYIFMLKVAYSADNVVSLYELAKQGVVLCDSSLDRLVLVEDGDTLSVGYLD